MKKIITALATIILAATMNAQVPQGIPYQAVLRDASGNIIASNASVQVEFKIFDNSSIITPVYDQTVTTGTNQFGLINAIIGVGGTLNSGAFSGINWSNQPISLNVKVNTGSGMVDMGTNPLYSVPFTLSGGSGSGTTPPSVNFHASYSDVLAIPGPYISTTIPFTTFSTPTYNVMAYDETNGIPSANVNNTTGVFTAPVAGKYHFDATVGGWDSFQGTAAILLKVNGVTTMGAQQFQYGLVSVRTTQISTDIKLSAGDQVSICVSQTGYPPTSSPTIYIIGEESGDVFNGHLISY